MRNYFAEYTKNCIEGSDTESIMYFKTRGDYNGTSYRLKSFKCSILSSCRI